MIEHLKNLLDRLNHWREQARLRHIEQEIEHLRLDIEDTYLHLNALIREKSRIEICQHRRETAPDVIAEEAGA